MSHHWKRTSLALLMLAATQLPTTAGAAGEIDEHVNKARDFVAAGDVRSAVIEMKNALQLDPSNAAAREMLGRIYLRADDVASAEKELRRAVALGGDSPRLRLDLAEALLRLDRSEDVLQYLEPLPEGDAGIQARAATLRGYVALKQNQTEQARAGFEQAMAADPAYREAYLGMVQLDLAANDLQTALGRIEQALEHHPKDLKALLVKGELLRKLGRADEALAVYDAAVAVDDKAVAAYLARVPVLLGLGRMEAAKADLDKVDELQPGTVLAKYYRAVLAFQERRFEAAREDVQAVLGALPNHAPSQLLYGLTGYAMGDYEVTEEYLGRFGPGSNVYPLVARVLGAARIKNKEPEKAVAVLEPLLQQHPGDPKLLQMLGVAYMSTGDYAKSAEALQKAAELEPGTAATRTQLAVGLLGSGKTDEAVAQLESVVEMDSDLVQADVLLVVTLLREQKFDKALEASQALEKRMPENPVAYNLTGLVYLSQKDLDQAAERFEKALSVDPDFVTAETNLARIDLVRKDFQSAEDRYRRTLAIQPENMTALIGMAGIAEQVGDEAQLIKWLETAIEKNPTRPQPAVLLGRHYLEGKQPLKALGVANDAISRLPDDPSVLEVLARAQSAAGESSSAVRTLERLVDRLPRDETYRLLAAAQLAIEDLRGARESLREALKLQPDSVPSKLTLASLALREKDYNQALTLAMELQKARPELEAPHRLEAAVRAAMGDRRLATEAYKRAYDLQPTAESARQLANLYELDGRTEDAIEIMRDWIEAHPDDLPSRMVMAVSYQKWGRKADAIAEYEAILQRDPGNAVLLNNLSWLYFETQDPRAMDTARRAYDLDPQRAEIADTYGWIMLQQGKQPKQALTLLQAAYVQAPNNREIGYHVAVALERLGRNNEAMRTLRGLLDDGASFPQRQDAEELRRKLQSSVR